MAEQQGSTLAWVTSRANIGLLRMHTRRPLSYPQHWGEAQRLSRELQDTVVSGGEPAMAPCRYWGAPIAMATRTFAALEFLMAEPGSWALTALVYTVTSHGWLYSPTLMRSGSLRVGTLTHLLY